jgi:dihydroorotate dehydrogenase (fumarate)
MVDLRTSYLGLTLENPVVASASTLTLRADTCKRLQDAGAGALVVASLFEEQLEHDQVELVRVLETGSESHGEALSYFPELEDYNVGADAYLSHLSLLKRELEIPVIASLNGTTQGGWIRYATRMQEAGADALELNVFLIATDPETDGAAVERRYLDLVAAVRAAITIPLAVKIGPFFSSIPNIAVRLVEAGADGLVLFNRFYQPDLDLATLAVDPTLHLSTSEEVRLPLRWIAVLRDHIRASLAATTGVHTAEDAMKLLLVGADVTMMASALYRNGPEHLREVVEGIDGWLAEHEYASVEQARGSVSRASSTDPEAFARSNYMRMLATFTSSYDWRGALGSPRA